MALWARQNQNAELWMPWFGLFLDVTTTVYRRLLEASMCCCSLVGGACTRAGALVAAVLHLLEAALCPRNQF